MVHLCIRGNFRRSKKVDQLADLEFLSSKILFPALDDALGREQITKLERDILKMAISKGTIKALDIKEIDPKLAPRARTYQITKMLEGKMLSKLEENGRIYVPSFMNNNLLRSIIKKLREEGFIKNLD